MKRLRQIRQGAILAGAIAALAGCTYYSAMQQLSAPEQERFRIYAKVMSSRQTQRYLKQQTAAARLAYLQEIGLAQRFQALAPEDREAVRYGQLRAGMSAEALRFLWGEPEYSEGKTGHYEYWYYQGSSWQLAESGNVFSEAGTVVIVDLVDGKVDGWLETVPTVDEHGYDGNREKH